MLPEPLHDRKGFCPWVAVNAEWEFYLQFGHMPRRYKPCQMHEVRAVVGRYNDRRESPSNLPRRLWVPRGSFGDLIWEEGLKYWGAHTPFVVHAGTSRTADRYISNRIKYWLQHLRDSFKSMGLTFRRHRDTLQASNMPELTASVAIKWRITSHQLACCPPIENPTTAKTFLMPSFCRTAYWARLGVGKINPNPMMERFYILRTCCPHKRCVGSKDHYTEQAGNV